MIIFKEKSSTDFDFFAILALYEASFPADERRSAQEFKEKLASEYRLHLVSAYDGEEFKGFISFWEFGSFTYVEHFAVAEQFRGQGLGDKILKYLLSRAQGPVVLEVEPPTGKLEQRRIAFYERHGFKLWNDVHYVQPPYATGKQPVVLKLMTTGMTSQSQVRHAAQIVRQQVYGVDNQQ